MNKISSTAALKLEITLLEVKQAQDKLALKQQFKAAYETLKPINLVKNIFKDLTASPDIQGDLINSTLGIGAGYLTKRVVIGTTKNPIKQLLGTLLQLGITGIVSKKGDAIKSAGIKLFRYLFKKKEETI